MHFTDIVAPLPAGQSCASRDPVTASYVANLPQKTALSEIRISDIADIEAMYNARLITDAVLRPLAWGRCQQLDAVCKKGGFHGRFSDYEGPRLRHLLDVSKSHCRKTFPSRFEQETAVGTIIRNRQTGDPLAVGIHTLPPYHVHRDKAYRQAIEAMLGDRGHLRFHDAARTRQFENDLRAGKVGMLWLIMQDMGAQSAAACAFYHSMRQVLRLRPDLRQMRTFHLDGLTVLINGRKATHAHLPGKNVASERFLKARGYIPFATEVVADAADLATMSSRQVSVDGVTVVTLPTWSHLTGCAQRILQLAAARGCVL